MKQSTRTEILFHMFLIIHTVSWHSFQDIYIPSEKGNVWTLRQLWYWWRKLFISKMLLRIENIWYKVLQRCKYSFWTCVFCEAYLTTKKVEYEKYWYEINQYEWYNGLLAMFSKTIDNILIFLGPNKMKMSHYFISLWYLLKLGTFLISEDPPP